MREGRHGNSIFPRSEVPPQDAQPTMPYVLSQNGTLIENSWRLIYTELLDAIDPFPRVDFVASPPLAKLTL